MYTTQMRTVLKYLALAFVLAASGVSLWAAERDYKPNMYYYQKVSLFRSLPVQQGATIMLGNSITDGGEWAELLGRNDILNRGISSDRTYGVLMRLDEIIRHQPSKVFLLIGINDLSDGTSPTTIRDNILRIVSGIKDGSPKTKIFVQSLLPVNDNFDRFGHVKYGKQVREINKDLEQMATSHGYVYLDLHSELMDSEGKLAKDYTNDGLHLMGEAYKRWAEFIRPLL